MSDRPISDYSDERLAQEDESPEAAVIRRAHVRFKKCQRWEAEARARWLDDYRFANGDAYNNYQWPDAIYETRGNRPSLTVNETRQHNLHIINEAKQNKADVEYRPVGLGASFESAQIYEGIYRHISNVSNAQMAQGKAIEFQVIGGLGFTRIRADYIDQESFEQDIKIQGLPDPMCVYLDCDSREIDGSDARYGFIFADKPRDEMELKYPQIRDRGFTANSVDGQDGGWLREDHIREAEYYEVEEESDELIGDDQGNTILRSEAPKKLIKAWEKEAEDSGKPLRRREVITKRCRWYKIVGDIIVDETDVPGTSVPIIPWVGEVTIIDQRLDRKGHTRCMIGAQQMLNYNWSASVEFGALQSKSPWLAPAAAIEGYETYFHTANTENHSVLPYNHMDDDSNPIPPPERQEPPMAAPVYSEGAQMASQFMMSVSGQYQAELGEQGNERTGKAINARQRQADRATYHFVDNQSLSIRRQGQIVAEWIPVIYDTPRVIKILNEDGTEDQINIDPQMDQAHAQLQQLEEGKIRHVLNPSVGKYEVISDVGPDWATQRQEAFNAIVQILTQAPMLIDKIGDLLFKVADFPLADEIAERLKPGMDPQAQAAITNLQTQLAKQNKLLGEAMQALTEERLKVKSKDADNAVKAFDADTRRLGVFKDVLSSDPQDMMAAIHETVRQALQDNLGPIVLNLQQSVNAQNAPDDGSPGFGVQSATPSGNSQPALNINNPTAQAALAGTQ